jgi:hypothetical protein
MICLDRGIKWFIFRQNLSCLFFLQASASPVHCVLHYGFVIGPAPLQASQAATNDFLSCSTEQTEAITISGAMGNYERCSSFLFHCHCRSFTHHFFHFYIYDDDKTSWSLIVNPD